MSDVPSFKLVRTGTPAYVAWRGDLLAQLALSRLPELKLFKPDGDQGWDYLAAADDGLCFFVEVKAFSSMKQGLSNVASVPELRWKAPPTVLARARDTRSPVVLFLFDADTDHGRYLRMDTLPEPARDASSVTLRLPAENVTTEAGLRRLIGELREAAPLVK